MLFLNIIIVKDSLKKYGLRIAIPLLLTIDEHLQAKKSLKYLAFALNFVTSFLFIKRGGIIGTFLLLKKVPIMDPSLLELLQAWTKNMRQTLVFM